MKKFLQKIQDRPISLIMLVIAPIATFYLLEWYTHDPSKTMATTPQVLNIILFVLIGLILFAAIGRLHVALMTETLFFCIYGLINYFVLDFRSVPIQPWDLFSIGTAASVANNYEYVLDNQAKAALAGFIVLLVIEFFCRFRLKKGSWTFRVPATALLLVGLVAFSFLFHSDEIVQQKGEMLFLKKNREVFVVWNCLSYQQKEYLINNFSDDERKKFCPGKFGSVENCVPDLWMLIKNKKEREERKRQWDEIDIPSWVTKY